MTRPTGAAVAISSMVAGGCIISGTEIRQSLLFTMVRTNSFASLDQAVLLPYVNVARHARLRKVVIDRGVADPRGSRGGRRPRGRRALVPRLGGGA